MTPFLVPKKAPKKGSKKGVKIGLFWGSFLALKWSFLVQKRTKNRPKFNVGPKTDPQKRPKRGFLRPFRVPKGGQKPPFFGFRGSFLPWGGRQRQKTPEFKMGNLFPLLKSRKSEKLKIRSDRIFNRIWRGGQFLGPKKRGHFWGQKRPQKYPLFLGPKMTLFLTLFLMPKKASKKGPKNGSF